MKVVIAPDSFKGSLGGADVAAAIGAGWRSMRPRDEVVLLPQADGGEGTIEAIAAHSASARRHRLAEVTGPDGRPVPGEWLELSGGLAVVELATSSGLSLMSRLDPLRATTHGMGMVLRDTVKSGVNSLVIALGGSASTDGGAGALTALGARFLDVRGRPIPPGGAALRTLRRIDLTGRGGEDPHG